MDNLRENLGNSPSQRRFGATSGPGIAASASARMRSSWWAMNRLASTAPITRGDQRGDADRARVMLEGVAEGVAARAEDRRPDEAAERVEQQEARPGEMIDPGEEGREGAQHGDEAAEEDDLAAVPLEQILRHLQPALVDVDVAPVAIDERKAELASDPVAGSCRR